MSSAKLTSKGQITIPADVRKALRLRTGDRLAFEVRDDGTAVVKPQKTDIMSLKGILKPKKRGVTIEQMNETIRRGWAGKLK